MKTKNSLVILFTLYFFQACTVNQKEQADSNVKRIELESDIERNLVDSLYFNSISFIPLETNDHSLLKKISRIYIDDDKLFIFDYSLNKIVIFDTKGKYLSRIHRIGNGPSEYIGSMDFCLDVAQKRVVLLCDRPYKIITFDYSGQFIDEKPIDDLYNEIIMPYENLFCYNNSTTAAIHKKIYELIYLDTDFNMNQQHLKLRESLEDTRNFSGKNLTKTLNCHYTRKLDNKIYQIERDSVIARYEIDFKKYALPAQPEKETAKNEDSPRKRLNYVHSISDVAENEKFLFFNTNIGIFVYDKQTEVLKGYKAIWNSKIRIAYSSFLSVGNSGTIIASVLDAGYFSHVKELSKKSKSFNNYELLELAKRIKIEDNPVLVLHEYTGN